MSEPEAESDEYAHFDEFARKVVNTPKPKASADALGSSTGKPADDGPKPEETDGDDH